MRFEPLDPEFQRDPYPAYAWLREHDPVHHHAATAHSPAYWVLSRFADVWDAVRRPEDFSSAQGLTFFPDEIGTLGLAPTIVMLDPPVHTRLRGLIGSGFTPRRVAALEDDVRGFVRERLQALRWGGDLYRDFASPIPTYVLAELLGVSPEDRARFGPWVRTLTSVQNDGFGLEGLGIDGVAHDGVAVIAEMFEYFSAVIAERRRRPSEDLIGALVTAELDGERLTDWDILGFCFVMVAGGSDTTAALIAHAATLLTQWPDQRQLLVEDPALIPNALLECLRLESSVQGLCRTTTREVAIGGSRIPAGEKVMMLYGSANRDEAEFGPTADVLDVRRTPARHLAFGSGPHFCIGSHIARLQARVALEELLASMPDLGVEAAAGSRPSSAFVRSWDTLPLAMSLR